MDACLRRVVLTVRIPTSFPSSYPTNPKAVGALRRWFVRGAAVTCDRVWFGEARREDGWRVAEQAVRQCDLLLSTGASGLVHSAAELPEIAQGLQTPVVIINRLGDEPGSLRNARATRKSMCRIARVG